MAESSKKRLMIKDPIYGYIKITRVEKRLIDTQPIQRLRRIRQLAGAEYVYPAANHTRFEHALGVMYLAGVLSAALPVGLNDHQLQKMKLAALLHDVGHAPFSHLFEPLLTRYKQKTHEDMTSWIVLESELKDILSDDGFNPREMGKLSVGRLGDKRRRYLDQMISSSVDVDKMDFIVRDSYHTGAGYGYVDVFRLIYTMDVLDGNLAVDATAISALEAFLLARLESFRTIYFHRASRAVQLMLLKALDQAKDELDLLNFQSPEDYLALDDFVVWHMLKESKSSKKIIQDLEKRRLVKCAFESTFFVKEEQIGTVISSDSVRQQMEKDIARIAKIDPEDISIDTPTLPSVPYHHAIDLDPMDIPVFRRGRNGRKQAFKVADLSRIVEVLRVYMNIIRVYTKREYRDEVRKASEKVLGEPVLSQKVSY